MSRQHFTLILLLVLVAPVPGCSRLLYNFGTIEDGQIYRSAQPSPMFLSHLARTYKIRTLINLRGDTDGFESAFAAQHGLNLFSFDLSASRPPTQADVERFLSILSDERNQPVLVHCRNGVDRTGYMMALYRKTAHRWSSARALREMNRYLQFELLNPVPARVVRDGLRKPE